MADLGSDISSVLGGILNPIIGQNDQSSTTVTKTPEEDTGSNTWIIVTVVIVVIAVVSLTIWYIKKNKS